MDLVHYEGGSYLAESLQDQEAAKGEYSNGLQKVLLQTCLADCRALQREVSQTLSDSYCQDTPV